MKILALMVSDIHLSHRPPAARAGESDWYQAMARPLRELTALRDQYDAPILCAGDIFHRWNPSPELINFALDHLPCMYCIPGQHDLPHHNISEVHRSAYGTLFKAKRITPLRTDSIPIADNLWVHGFPWGCELAPALLGRSLARRVALVHKYIWTEEAGSYPNADPSGRADNVLEQLQGYDVVVTGDNHMSFEYEHLFNCGGFMRRSIADRDHRPRVGLLMEDLSFRSHYLDTSLEQFEEVVEKEEEFDFVELMEDLKRMETDSLDFEEAVRHYADKAEVPVREVLVKALEDSHE